MLVGLESQANLEPAPTYPRPGRVVIYGTSIAQGGCASRPGMAYPAILSRRLGIEIASFGFSGNGKGEPEVAHILAELDDVAVFVLDYDANVADVESLRTTLTRFVPILRQAHPYTPILVISRPVVAKESYSFAARADRVKRGNVQREIVDQYQAAGDDHISFLDLGDLDYADATVDGIHATDLGFLRLANAIEPSLRSLLPTLWAD